MTLNSLQRDIARRLGEIYPSGEARWIARIVMEHVTGKDSTYLLIHADDEVSEFRASQVEAMMQRLLAHEPVQYVTGHAPFYGLDFEVNPSVLIPRPETAELVDMIVADSGRRADLRVADIGTGSGCIAIALALNLPFSHVTGYDLSAEAVKTATANASRLKARGAAFEVADAFELAARAPEWELDIVVSNPPYIADSERVGMEANVLDYEPPMALFVPDADPLRFYSAISRYAMKALKSGGRLYYEINPRYARVMVADTRAAGFDDVTLHRDSHGRERFLSATHP